MHKILTLLFSYSCLLIMLTSCFFSGLKEPHSIEYDPVSFNKLAKDILSQDKIFEMDDFTRHYKRLNNINIRLDSSAEKNDSFTTFIYSLTDSLKVNRNLLDQLRIQLEKTQLREFFKSNDSILFRADGFNGTSWGFFYSTKPLSNDSLPFHFNKHSVEYIYNINDNWKKVAIHP